MLQEQINNFLEAVVKEVNEEDQTPMTAFLCEGFVERSETEATRAASHDSLDDVSSKNSGSDNEGDLFDNDDFDDRDRSDSARQSLLVDQLFS